MRSEASTESGVASSRMEPASPPTAHVSFRSSPIHGLGGFARADLSPNTRVIEYRGEKIDKRESNERCSRNNGFIFYFDGQFNLDGNVEWNPARFINHSCAPNCRAELLAGRIWLVAGRLIPTGEEITFDYGYDLENYREHPCHCGATGCAGFIVAGESMDLIGRIEACRRATGDPVGQGSKSPEDSA